jgi:hypothetical protein
MFNKDKNPAGIDLVIKLATDELLKHQPDSPEYVKIIDQLERLNKIALSNRSDRVSKDGIIAGVVNLVGIGMIIRHEQLNVITSKALGFVFKARV